jgi:hypothetical protein
MPIARDRDLADWGRAGFMRFSLEDRNDSVDVVGAAGAIK